MVVDSSGWLEFLTDGPLADTYAARLRQPAAVITPTIVIYEVYKHAKRLLSEEAAVDAVAVMQKTRVVPLTDELALVAADLSLAHKLPMADAIVLATAQAHEADVVTSDADFADISGVVYIPKK
ncbi:MAG TPA: type II toxin-antitoxin system VapC family toxin [Thermoanaerobaculia bacterium]|nr:type II toxin-antitoxin system VapC family toxin [Thermoanaerobaculia bacterium]